jgi:hypothetical protein
MRRVDLRREAKILENTSFKEAFRTGIGQNLVQFPMNLAVGMHHFRDSWLRAAPNERVAQFAHDAFGCAVMDIGISLVQIAETNRIVIEKLISAGMIEEDRHQVGTTAFR